MTPADSASSDAAHDGAVAATLEVRVGREVEFVLHVTNATEKRLELNFPSGQTHDVIVLDAAGREVWRWSEGRLFTQALQNRLLSSGETATYQQRWAPREQTGTFTAIAILASSNHPVELRRGFALP